MSLDGKWYNELGSELNLKAEADGQLSGTYKTAVSSRGCAKGEFPLAGRTDVLSEGETLGFAVSWQNSESKDCNSTTTWVGHYRPGGDGVEESLTTFWLLAEKAGPKEEWESTMLGKDTFVRQTAKAGQQEESPVQVQTPNP